MTPVRDVRTLIIGAGPTGLGAAWRLKERGETDFLILERAAHAGGLASSFTDDRGFTWDVGGHVQFSHYDYFDTLMRETLGSDGWLEHQRESWAWMARRFIPYPVQNNIRHLPPEQLARCLDGLRKLGGAPSGRPAHFGEWIDRSFGEGLAALFMRPYNYKVWAYPPDDLSYSWIGERVATVDLARIERNIAEGRDDLSWGPNNLFRFPKQGGTGEIWRRLAGRIGAERIMHGADVALVDAKKRMVSTADGRSWRYERLLSTMPLDVLVSRLSGRRDDLDRAASHLVHSTSHIVGLGLAGEPPPPLRTKCWMYFPESDCPFYRVTVFSNYSPANVPDPARFWSLMAETSESPKKPVDRAQVLEQTIQGCLNTGLLKSRADIVSTWTMTAPHGYPTPSLRRDEALSTLLPALDAMGVYSRGRFGGWKYEVSNQDHSAMQGVEWVDFILDGKPEQTLPFPAVVNAPRR